MNVQTYVRMYIRVSDCVHIYEFLIVCVCMSDGVRTLLEPRRETWVSMILHIVCMMFEGTECDIYVHERSTTWADMCWHVPAYSPVAGAVDNAWLQVVLRVTSRSVSDHPLLVRKLVFDIQGILPVVLHTSYSRRHASLSVCVWRAEGRRQR